MTDQDLISILQSYNLGDHIEFDLEYQSDLHAAWSSEKPSRIFIYNFDTKQEEEIISNP